MDTAVSSPALAGFDPGPQIRRSVLRHAGLVPSLRKAARDLARFARMKDAARADAALEPRFAALRAALWRSPYCRESLRRASLAPADLRGLGDLVHFPLLDRETLRVRFDDLPALGPGAGKGGLLVERSSGTTGLPVPVLKDEGDTVHMWALLRFWLRWAGERLPSRPRVALVCPLSHGVEYETPLPALASGRLARVSLARPNPAGRLRAFSPHVVFTDPGGLHWLAGQARMPRRPRLVLSSALHLSPHLRRRAEAALGVPILNYYSTSETGPVAWECLAAPGRFHVLRPDVWVESVGGEIVVTRLRESVLPLLRYRTGDRGEVRPEACSCGYHGHSIVAFAGRRACRFAMPSGGEVDAWQLAWVFRHHPLDAFRLSQTGEDAFRLETVGDRGVALGASLRAALRALGWSAPRLEVRRVRAEDLAGTKPEPFVRLPPGAWGAEATGTDAGAFGPCRSRPRERQGPRP